MLSIPLVYGQQIPPNQFPELKPKADVAPTENTTAYEEDEGFTKKRDLWFIQQRAFPFAHILPGARTAALKEHLALKQASAHSVPSVNPDTAVQPEDAFTTLSWTFDGPSAVSAGSGAIPYSGRATSLAINPANPLIMYLGTAGGGVWKTTDGGQTWAPITDTQASLAVGAITIDPNNVNTLYVGTGEADYSGDSYYGQGLLKSTDAGATWTQIATPFISGGSAQPFAQIAIQPGNSSVLVAATSSGIYRSTNAGLNWTNILPSYASAVIFDPGNSSTVYAGMNGYFNSIVYGSVTAAIYKSVDAGVTWAPVTGSGSNTLPAGSLVYRTALTMDSSGNLLAGIAPSSAASGTPYKSSDGGATWKALTPPGDGIDWYRDWIITVPGSPNVIYAGGVSLFQSLDGGVTWTKSTQSYATLLWADQHAAVMSPDGSKMYLMDDGGIFMTATPGATNPTFVSLNNGIGSMTFYPGFGITNSGGTLVGAQDHGTQIGTGSLSWLYAGGGNVCGDGGQMAIDSAGVYAYAHCQGSPLSSWMSSATAGAVQGQAYPYGWVSAQAGITLADRTSFVPPLATDPSNAPNVYTGTYRVYQSTNHAANWTAISGDLTAGQSNLNTLAVAPTNANVVYAGAGDGTISVTTNALQGASATWSKLTGLPQRSITKIFVAPDSAQDVYVTVSGFGTGHIFHSTNGGTTWTNISGNLPNTPANSVAVDPSLLNTIYLATDTGVYVTSNGGTVWEVLGANLPNVVVLDVQIVAATRLLRIVTHGRGAWDLTLPLNGFVASTNLVAFGTQPINTASASQTVTLSNDLITAVTISSITSSAAFPQTNTCGSSLASGATCTISVSFSPTTTGSANGTLTVVSNQGNLSLALTGTGTAPSVALTPVAVTFGNQSVGAASTAQTVTLTNSGSASLTGIAISTTGANATDFAQTNTCVATLASGNSCTISIVFTPAGAGSRTAALSIVDNATGSPQAVPLSGTGVAPAVAFSSGSIAFGSQPLGFVSATQTVNLQNTGTGPLSGIAVSVSGTNSSDFNVSSACGTTLAAASSCTISVTFSPGALGSRTATLAVADNASGSPQMLAITGTGAAPFTLSGSVTSASVKAGSTASYALTFTPATGTTALSPATLSCTGLPSLSSCSFAPASIATGSGTTSVTLSVSTTAATTGALELPPLGRKTVEVLTCTLFLLWLAPRKRRRRWMLMIALGAGSMTISSCSKTSTTTAGGGSPGTPLGSYTVTVTAQATSYTATQSLTLLVQ